MSEYVVTFDPRPITGAGALAGLRRTTLAEARETVAVAARIPKVGRIINAETLAEYAPAPRSGYTSCACRDCMEIIVANNPARPELCDDCNTAGCGDPGAQGWPECQRGDAYEDA